MSESKDPTSFNTPGRETLKDVDIKGVGQAVLTLTHEIWVLTDRLRVIEAVLEERGIDIHDDVNNFEPDATLEEDMKAQSQALVARVLAALNSGD